MRRLGFYEECSMLRKSIENVDIRYVPIDFLTQLAGLLPVGFNAMVDDGPCQSARPEASCRFQASSRIAAMSPPNFSAMR